MKQTMEKHMRGQPVHGFRLTRKRIAAGVLTKKLAAQHRQIEQAEREGKTLSPSLLKAHREMTRNIRVAREHRLLSPKIDGQHAVVKSAKRREVLLKVG